MVSEQMEQICHETTARAARLERSGSVTLWSSSVSELRDVWGFRLDVAEAVATLPLMKGPKGSVRGEA